MKQFFENTKPGGRLFALILIFVVCFIITAGVMMVPILVGGNPASLWLQAVSQLLSFALPAIIFAYLFHEGTFSYLKMSTPVKSRGIVGAAVVLLCLIPLSDWLATVNDAWHLPESMSALEAEMRRVGETSQQLLEDFLMRDGVGALVVNLFVMAVLPALCEELFFRGAIQQTLAECFRNRHAAVWLTAAIFSLFHGEMFAFLPRFMLGVALGYLFLYGASLWVNATAHFVNNAIVVVVYYLANRGVVDLEFADSFSSPWYLAAMGLVLASVLFWLFFLRGREKTRESEHVDPPQSQD